MPYFFILPCYLALFIGLIGAGVVTRFIPRFRAGSGYLIGGAIGSLVGFVTVNILLILAGVAPAWLAQKFTFPIWLTQVSKFFVAAVLLLGPFIASSLGVLLGFAGGIYFVYRRNKRSLSPPV
jgi:hypothetical protein